MYLATFYRVNNQKMMEKMSVFSTHLLLGNCKFITSSTLKVMFLW